MCYIGIICIKTILLLGREVKEEARKEESGAAERRETSLDSRDEP